MSLKGKKIEKMLNNPARTADWITPKEYTEALEKFSLDPCASLNQKWFHASTNWDTLSTPNSLDRDWFGRVWLNPPYSENALWMERMNKHNDGIALVPARTDTRWFQKFIFYGNARGILFLKGRIKFYGSEGYAKHSCTFPVSFIGYGDDNAYLLKKLNMQDHPLFKGYYTEIY